VTDQPIEQTAVHWSASADFRGKLRALKGKHKTSAMMKDDVWEIWLHNAFDVKSLTELKMTPEVALDIITTTASRVFNPRPSATAPEAKPANAPSDANSGQNQNRDTSPLPSTPPIAQSVPVVAPKTGEEKMSGKKEEIRQKYTAKLKGKDYLEVQGRVLLFRNQHPDWSIETDMAALDDTSAVFKATVRNAEGRIIATGHGRASEEGTKHLGGRYIEKAETAAIGRALALAGFGTDSSLDDSDYLSDNPRAA
jgi:hypothetical protein